MDKALFHMFRVGRISVLSPSLCILGTGTAFPSANKTAVARRMLVRGKYLGAMMNFGHET